MKTALVTGGEPPTPFSGCLAKRLLMLPALLSMPLADDNGMKAAE